MRFAVKIHLGVQGRTMSPAIRAFSKFLFYRIAYRQYLIPERRRHAVMLL